ncbi:hypothetical protein SO802_015914 [Lithocarpus litseifolius]|uniref:Uncharacterized protein n=1 Tax=Lithocarpus litseifolius TaxID=425828 RepID=A0AAW2CV12_9ROSI
MIQKYYLLSVEKVFTSVKAFTLPNFQQSSEDSRLPPVYIRQLQLHSEVKTESKSVLNNGRGLSSLQRHWDLNYQGCLSVENELKDEFDRTRMIGLINS